MFREFYLRGTDSGNIETVQNKVLDRTNLVAVLVNYQGSANSRQFNQNLKVIYDVVNKDKKVFEVVYCSYDNSKGKFETMIKNTRWLNYPYDPFSDIQTLLLELGVKASLPMLIFFNKDGSKAFEVKTTIKHKGKSITSDTSYLEKNAQEIFDEWNSRTVDFKECSWKQKFGDNLVELFTTSKDILDVRVSNSKNTFQTELFMKSLKCSRDWEPYTRKNLYGLFTFLKTQFVNNLVEIKDKRINCELVFKEFQQLNFKLRWAYKLKSRVYDEVKEFVPTPERKCKKNVEVDSCTLLCYKLMVMHEMANAIRSV